jgi:hypothetical protein
MKFVVDLEHPTLCALSDILNERDRQDAKFGAQRQLPMGTMDNDGTRADEKWAKIVVDNNTKKGMLSWADILTEEYREAMAEEDPRHLREELVQMVTVGLRMIENLHEARA